MAELPENVDLQWLARHLVEFRRETRDELQALSRDFLGLRDETQGLRDQTGVLVASLLRVERNLSAVRQDIRVLFDADRDLRRRVEAHEERLR
jgi:predicted  nucleic acid-binding Zn-ribbon protein